MTMTPNRQALFLVAMLALAGLYFIYAVNVFVDESLDTVRELRIELDEALLYGVFMTLVFGGYASWLYATRRRQHARRLAAEADTRVFGFTDALTGLGNRRCFDTALGAMLADSRPERCDAVLLIDLDGFKQVNDRHGHAAGDALLKVVADRIANAVREGDRAARFGGDEFAVLAPAAGDAAAAAALARRIVATVALPVTVGDAVLRVGASVGIALAREAAESRGLLAAADAALYRAKRSGSGVEVAADAAVTPTARSSGSHP